MTWRRWPEWLLVVGLIAVAGWPTCATLLAPGAGSDVEVGPAGGGLMDPSGWGLDTGGWARPARLAAETLRVVGVTLALAWPAGVALAILVFRTDLWGRRAVLWLLIVSALVPLPLVASGWLGGFGNAGRAQLFGIAGAPVLTGWFGAAVVHAVAVLPWITLMSGIGLRAVESELEDAARLERSAPMVLWTVTLVRARGFLVTTGLAAAVLVAGEMTVTDLLQVRTYAEEAYLQYTGLGRPPAVAAAPTLPVFLLLSVLVAWSARSLARLDPGRLASDRLAPRTWRLGGWRTPLEIAVVALTAGLLAVPTVSLTWRAGRVGGLAARGLPPHWSWNGLVGTLDAAQAEIRDSLVKSVVLGSLAATLTVVLAWTLAWAARSRWSWGAITVIVIALLLAAPGPVVGMALVLAYHTTPTVADTPLIVILAMTARTLPYALLVLVPAVRTVPRPLNDAASLEGWSEWGRAWLVGLPLTWRSLAAAWAVTAVLAFGELPATNLVEPPSFTNLATFRIWQLLHTGVESHMAGVALVMLGAVALLALPAAGLLVGSPGLRRQSEGLENS